MTATNQEMQIFEDLPVEYQHYRNLSVPLMKIIDGNDTFNQLKKLGWATDSESMKHAMHLRKYRFGQIATMMLAWMAGEEDKKEGVPDADLRIQYIKKILLF